MALPLNNTITYKLTIPSTNKQIKFRPFLVKDEKALLTAKESEDLDTIIETLKYVLTSCTFNEVDPGEISIFDFEYIFAQIRAKSVGEVSEIYFKCGKCKDEKNLTKIEIDLTKVEISKSEDHNSNIPLYGSVGVVMKYPTVDLLSIIEKEEKTSKDVFDLIIKCIDYIYDDDEIYYAHEQTHEELEEFLDALTSDQLNRVAKFFDTMPKFKKDIEFNCPSCGQKNKSSIEGLQNFFS